MTEEFGTNSADQPPPQLKILTVVLDEDTDELTLNWDGLSHFEALGMLVQAVEVVKGGYTPTEEDDDE